MNKYIACIITLIVGAFVCRMIISDDPSSMKTAGQNSMQNLVVQEIQNP